MSIQCQTCEAAPSLATLTSRRCCALSAIVHLEILASGPEVQPVGTIPSEIETALIRTLREYAEQERDLIEILAPYRLDDDEVVDTVRRLMRHSPFSEMVPEQVTFSSTEIGLAENVTRLQRLLDGQKSDASEFTPTEIRLLKEYAAHRMTDEV